MTETNTATENEVLSDAKTSSTETLKKDENKSVPENKTAPTATDNKNSPSTPRAEQPKSQTQGRNQAPDKPPWENTAPSATDKSPASIPASTPDKSKSGAEKPLTEAKKSETALS